LEVEWGAEFCFEVQCAVQYNIVIGLNRKEAAAERHVMLDVGCCCKMSVAAANSSSSQQQQQQQQQQQTAAASSSSSSSSNGSSLAPLHHIS
jgi:hypothetical protein